MIKKKQVLVVIVLLFVICSTSFCASLTEHQKMEYGVLESAVTFSSDKVIGEYGDAIPEDLGADKFILFGVKSKGRSLKSKKLLGVPLGKSRRVTSSNVKLPAPSTSLVPGIVLRGLGKK